MVKKSRFIGRCFPVGSEREAAERLEAVRKSCWDATHNCYAWRIGAGARSSDDGEPSGTAGAPILNVLTKRELIGVLCVVTRYFGGVLLGAGGLIRAYTDASAAAVQQAGIVLMQSCTAYEMTVPYPLFGLVENLAAGYGGLAEKAFGESVRAVIWVRDAECAGFLERMKNATDARVAPRPVASALRPLELQCDV
ncbi:MAG: YigZ family protein [Clostridia bacterium]|nr:YigZ family protein [Clostridia bacterium]